MNPKSPHPTRTNYRQLLSLALAFLPALLHATVNHRPTVNRVDDRRITGGSFENPLVTVGDDSTPAASLTVTATSSNVDFVTANITGTGDTRTVELSTPTEDGYAAITITVTDSGNKSTFTSFVVQRAAAVANNTPPTLSRLPDMIIPAGTTSYYGPVGFQIADSESDESTASGITLSAVYSSDPAFVSLDTDPPTNNITFGGEERGRTVTVDPNNGLHTATIVIAVTDDGKKSGSNGTGDPTTSYTSFVVTTVAANNVAPTFTTDLPTFFRQNVGGNSAAIPFAVNDPVTNDATNVAVTISTSDQIGLFASPPYVDGSGTNRTLHVTPNTTATGAATIYVDLDDGDLTTHNQLLFVVVDPAGVAATTERSTGVFALDTADGGTYTPSWGGNISDRTDAITTTDGVDGFTLRVQWADVESPNAPATPDGPNDYDFTIIERALAQLPAGQHLSIIVVPNEPAYIADYIVNQSSIPDDVWSMTGKGGNTLTRAVPWDPYLATRRHRLIEAMADAPIGAGGIPLSADRRLVTLNTYLRGGDTGMRDPTTALKNMAHYSRENLRDTVIDELELLQDNFPGRVVQIGFWAITDNENTNPDYSAYPILHDWLAAELSSHFDGANRPKIGYFMENLAASRTDPSQPAYSGTPTLSYAEELNDAAGWTWNGFQMNGCWFSPINDNQAGKTRHGTPSDALEYAYNNFDCQYAEIYADDISASGEVAYTAYHRGLLGWHDFYASLTAPHGLDALPASSTTTSVSWESRADATAYTLERRTSGNPFPGTSLDPGTGTTFADSGLSPGTLYYYRVKATTTAGATSYSAPYPVMTWFSDTFTSVGADDGYIVVNGSTNPTVPGGAQPGLRAGHGGGTTTLKTFLHFDVSLPAGATVHSAHLRLYQLSGATSVTVPGTMEIKAGSFSGNPALESSDATDTGIALTPTIPVGTDNSWIDIDLSGDPAALANIIDGSVEFRVSNPVSGSNVYVGWGSGESTTPPELVIEYE